MARLLIGLAERKGKLKTYAKRYALLEVRPVDDDLPGAKTLRKWRDSVRPSFAFSVQLSAQTGLLKDDTDEALARSLAAAAALEAHCIVLTTPASVRPTKINRKKIIALAARLPQQGHILAWEARGMWSDEEVMATAAEAGLLPIFDAAQEPLAPGPVAYTRIRSMGRGAQLSSGRLERIAEQLANRREAYVVVDDMIARKLASSLPQAVERLRLPRANASGMVFRPGGAIGGDASSGFGLDEEG
jgi:uncharacterized protein YecE (DUF72 family)